MGRINKESIDRFYDYDIYTETRTIYIGSVESDMDKGESGTDAAMAERAIKGLHLLDTSAPVGDKAITVIMNNPGGDYYHGMAIYDAIKSCKNHVTVVIYGHVMSMGSIILQAADKRVMTQNSTLMIHYGYINADGASKNFERIAAENKRLDKVTEKILLDRIKQKNPKFLPNKIKEMLEFDTFLTAEQALELGLIDEILGEEPA